MRANTLLLSLIGAATVAIAAASAAQEQPATVPPPVASETAVVPAPAPAAASAPASVAAIPARGSTMDTVKSKFGAPLQEAPPVGIPAITRWDYSGFAVFFENDKVLHTVIAR
jgi:hypothetical protein